MKNDHRAKQSINQAREHKVHKAMPTDILRIPEVVEGNMQRIASQPRRRRRVNYEKKIMMDDFIMKA
jgi:hypothetical protein